MQPKYQIRNRAYRRRMKRKRHMWFQTIMPESMDYSDCHSLRWKPVSYHRHWQSDQPTAESFLTGSSYMKNVKKTYKKKANRKYRNGKENFCKGNDYRKLFHIWDLLS